MSCPNGSSCTGIHIHDPQYDRRPWLTYYEWLEKNKESDSERSEYRFLRSQKLCIDPNDPKDYPGLHHASERIVFCDLEELGQHEHTSLRNLMTQIYKSHQNHGLFLADDVFGKDEDWKVVRQMSSASGYFNCGVYIVEDTRKEKDTRAVLKVLPCSAKWPKYASREINILWKVKDHPNIIEIQDSFLPDDRQTAPWTITSLCNSGTLKKFAEDLFKRRAKICIPEFFIWHLFESILEAVHYCHVGPPDQQQTGTWDPIYHRDIVRGNFFLDFSKSFTDPIYPTIKLADSGCAVTQSEVEERSKLEQAGAKVDNLAQVCPSAVPPEGEEGICSPAMDIWQLGLAVLRFLAMTRLGYEWDHDDDVRSGKLLKHVEEHHAGQMEDLRRLLMLCLAEDPSRRPTAAQLLGELRECRTVLMLSGKLRFRPLDFIKQHA